MKIWGDCSRCRNSKYKVSEVEAGWEKRKQMDKRVKIGQLSVIGAIIKIETEQKSLFFSHFTPPSLSLPALLYPLRLMGNLTFL